MTTAADSPSLPDPGSPRNRGGGVRISRGGVGEGETPTREAYLRLHRLMCATKALDDRMHMLVRQGRAPFVGSARGHEGIQAAAVAAISPEDWLVPHYR